MECRILVLDSDLAAYTAQFAMHSGIQFPYQYLRNAIVHGLYLDNEMVGGFVITEGDTMRWYKQIPVAQSKYLSTVDKSQIFEVNGLWLNPELRKSRHSVDAWRIIIKQLLAHRKPIPTIAFLEEREGLGRLYRKVSGGEVYSGPMLENSKILTVLAVSKFKLRFWRLAYLKTYARRMFVQSKIEQKIDGQNYKQKA